MIIEVDIPPFHTSERIYTLDIILGTILGVNYRLHIKQSPDYVITLPNGKIIRIADHFFLHHPDDYLAIENIPKSICWMSNQFTQNRATPILYGDDRFTHTSDTVICNADIFASAFFMLSRWEETVQVNECDQFGRFHSHIALAVRHGFITLPIVNMYVSFLKNIIEHQLYTIDIQSNFRRVFSVDVDYAMRLPHPISCFRAVASALLKQQSVGSALKHLRDYLFSSDEYDTYSKIIDIACQRNASLQWYLLCNDENVRFWKKNYALLQQMQSIGSVGLHPSILASGSLAQLSREKETLEFITKQKITDNRFHFLAGQMPNSWHVLADLGFTSDSSLYYTASPGFRTGCCTPHLLFSVYRKCVLPITEYPLMAMDASVLHVDPLTVIADFTKIKYECESYGGTFTFLWHNSSFGNQWQPHETLLHNLLL